MKINNVQTYPVRNPTPDRGGPGFLFIKLTTDGGVEGIGEIFCTAFSPSVAAVMAEDVCDRLVIGSDPFKIERLWRVIYSSGYTQHPDLSRVAILSGIEMACWDIIGKELGKPIYELLGGQVHERLRTYTYIYDEEEDVTDVYSDPDLAAERALEYVSRGFTALKFDPTGPYSAFDPRHLRRPASSTTLSWSEFQAKFHLSAQRCWVAVSLRAFVRLPTWRKSRAVAESS